MCGGHLDRYDASSRFRDARSGADQETAGFGVESERVAIWEILLFATVRRNGSSPLPGDIECCRLLLNPAEHSV
jgi:hypothetical protein